MSELKPCPQRYIDILWAEVCSNQQPLHCTRKELCDAVQMAEEAIRRAQPNEPLTCEGCGHFDGAAKRLPYVCQVCKRGPHLRDYYRRKPEPEGGKS